MGAGHRLVHVVSVQHKPGEQEEEAMLMVSLFLVYEDVLSSAIQVCMLQASQSRVGRYSRSKYDKLFLRLTFGQSWWFCQRRIVEVEAGVAIPTQSSWYGVMLPKRQMSSPPPLFNSDEAFLTGILETRGCTSLQAEVHS